MGNPECKACCSEDRANELDPFAPDFAAPSSYITRPPDDAVQADIPQQVPAMALKEPPRQESERQRMEGPGQRPDQQTFEGPQNFVCQVEKTPEVKSAGVVVGRFGNQAYTQVLGVKEIKEGLVKNYNNTAPTEKQVKPGDIILEVNGIRGDTKAMLNAVANDSSLRFVVESWPEAPEGWEWSSVPKTQKSRIVNPSTGSPVSKV